MSRAQGSGDATRKVLITSLHSGVRLQQSASLGSSDLATVPEGADNRPILGGASP